jgi:hypothetical protein
MPIARCLPGLWWDGEMGEGGTAPPLVRLHYSTGKKDFLLYNRTEIVLSFAILLGTSAESA